MRGGIGAGWWRPRRGRGQRRVLRARRFRETTGTTPLQWLCAERVRRAQDLLENTDDTIERIATLCGSDPHTRCVRTSRGSTTWPRTRTSEPSGPTPQPETAVSW